MATSLNFFSSAFCPVSVWNLYLFCNSKNRFCSGESAKGNLQKKEEIFVRIFIQERLAAWLVSVKLSFDKRGTRLSGGWNAENVIKMFNMGTDLTKPFEYLLATGNLNSKTGMTIPVGNKYVFLIVRLLNIVCPSVHRSRHAAEHRPLCCSRQTQLYPLPVSLPLCAQRGRLRQNEDHFGA